MDLLPRAAAGREVGPRRFGQLSRVGGVEEGAAVALDQIEQRCHVIGIVSGPDTADAVGTGLKALERGDSVHGQVEPVADARISETRGGAEPQTGRRLRERALGRVILKPRVSVDPKVGGAGVEVAGIEVVCVLVGLEAIADRRQRDSH